MWNKYIVSFHSFSSCTHAQERAATPNGRCETVVSRWFGVSSNWKGYGRNTCGSFEFWVRTLLPRYHNMWKIWFGSANSCHKHAGLWGSGGIGEGRMLKSRVLSKTPFPRCVHRRYRGRGRKKVDVYSLLAYLKHACDAVNQVCACVHACFLDVY